MPMPTSLAPGYARITYDGELFPHHMTLPVNFDGTPTPGSEPDLILKDATTSPAATALAALFAKIQPHFSTSKHIGLCELHTVDATTGADAFIYSFNLGLLGTSAFADVPTGQVVLNFKTALGGIYKMYLMEGIQTPNLKVYPPYGAGIFKDLSDFIVGNTSPIYGRGNSYPFTPISYLSKTNDKLRKQQGLA